AERGDRARLVAEEDELVSQHGQVHGLAAHLPCLDGRIPVLAEAQLRAVVEGADLGGAIRLLHRALGEPAAAVSAVWGVHGASLPVRRLREMPTSPGCGCAAREDARAARPPTRRT